MTIIDKQKIDVFLGSILIVLLKIPVYLMGILLKRNHSIEPKGEILFIKMQGGGSLVLAYPMLLGIKKKYPLRNLALVTTPSVIPFAKSLDVFNRIIPINDRNLSALIATSAKALVSSFHFDTVVDLEVYSKLTTVFSALTLARNRIGFYLDDTFWRRNIHTHLIFFNRFSCVTNFYNEIAIKLNASPAPLEVCSKEIRKNIIHRNKTTKFRQISVGHACSDMGTERMLTPSQWLIVGKKKIEKNDVLIFLGTQTDFLLAEKIITLIKQSFPKITLNNLCGKLSLIDSLSYIESSDEFWGIDSSLLHYARLLGKKTISFWGPTSPFTRLQKDSALNSEVYYNKISCSPCIHVAETPPCQGKHLCIEILFGKNRSDEPTIEPLKMV